MCKIERERGLAWKLLSVPSTFSQPVLWPGLGPLGTLGSIPSSLAPKSAWYSSLRHWGVRHEEQPGPPSAFLGHQIPGTQAPGCSPGMWVVSAAAHGIPPILLCHFLSHRLTFRDASPLPGLPRGPSWRCLGGLYVGAVLLLWFWH